MSARASFPSAGSGCGVPSLVAMLIVLSAAHCVHASSGDQRKDFKICVHQCETTTGCASLRRAYEAVGSRDRNVKESNQKCSAVCLHTIKSHIKADVQAKDTLASKDTNTTDSQKVPMVFLKLARWDCSADCRYLCMWLVEEDKGASIKNAAATRTRVPVEKYYGKWPFIRCLGAQEPASVVFSLCNMAATLYCFIGVSKKILMMFPKTTDGKSQTRTTVDGTQSTPIVTIFNAQPYPFLWALHFVLSANAWLWSAVFHSRDTRYTERWDYFSAGAVVAYNLFFTLARVGDAKRPFHLASIAALIFVVYGMHVRSMVTVLFDYGKHVMLCVVAGAIQTVAWAVWAMATRQGRTHTGRSSLLAFMASINLAMLLEILDFPPIWGVFDAHALWHAVTAPLTLLWYRFVLADVGMMCTAHTRGKES